ncbi:MAG: hypothetical protein KF784_07775 [Fimbriimonadaceae bacterium]|nr:hypothetical protein [Fimbriimonadaceae bacterium]
MLERGKLPIVLELSSMSPGEKEAVVDIVCQSGIKLPIAWNMMQAPEAKISIEPYAEIQISGQGKMHQAEIRPGQGSASVNGSVISSVEGAKLLEKIENDDPSVRVPENIREKYTEDSLVFLLKGYNVGGADQTLMVDQAMKIIRAKVAEREKLIDQRINGLLSRLSQAAGLLKAGDKEQDFADFDSSAQEALIDWFKPRFRELGLKNPGEVDGWLRSQKVKVKRASIEIGFNFRDSSGLTRGAYFDIGIVK